MDWINQTGAALKVTAQVARQGRFWFSMLRALSSLALLLMAGVMVALYFAVGNVVSIVMDGFSPSNIAFGLALLACLIAIGPLMMRAWCPPAARAVADAMQLDLPELPVPSLGNFIAAWLLVVIIGILLLVAAFFIPRPFGWLMMLPAALLLSSYQVRCALCLHADAGERQLVAGATMGRRVLLWFPLCSMPLFLYSRAEVAVKAWFVSPYELTVTTAFKVCDVFGVVVGLAVLAIVLVLWAALSLQALAEHHANVAALTGRRARRTVAPAPAPAMARPPVRSLPRNARPVGAWVTMALGVMLAMGAVAYLARTPLLHNYLAFTDQDYALQASFTRNRSSGEALDAAYVEAACNGNLKRIKLLMRMHIAATPDTLGAALACAAKAGDMQTASFLIDKKANVNAIPVQRDPALRLSVTALQYAAAAKNQALVDLLLSQGADASLQAPESPGALHFAALNMDTDMIAVLIKAGAKANAPTPKAPIFYFLEKAAEGQSDRSAPAWAAVIARAERAGLSAAAVDADGANLLHWAADRGELGLIEVLLARGLDRHQQDKRGAMPFMMLANWYPHASTQPGPEFEFMLKALTSGVPDINMVAFVKTASHGVDQQWTLAKAASGNQRVRSVFGERINYALLNASQYSFANREQAALLIADLSAAQIAAASSLPVALRRMGMEDLALQVEGKR